MKGLLTSLITVLTFTGLQAQPLPATPKLVIGLTIDQLRTDYLEAFSSLYGERGFKRLWKEGRVYRNTEYTFNEIDRASGIAAIYTGTTPSINGIVSNQWLDIKTLRPIECVDDLQFMGNYTSESSSPARLLTSTITDELKIATQNRGLVYAIAPFREAAILAAGHAGNGAYWLNQNTGKWCSTTYYPEFPFWVSQYNDKQAIDFRIEDLTWTPVHDAERYTFLPDWRKDAFKYNMDDGRQYKYHRFITSPFVNDEVNALTLEFLDKGSLGKDEVPDFLSLTYYAGNFDNKSTQESAMELMDTYVRLDQTLSRLLDLIEKKVGLQNTLFFITSTGYVEDDGADAGFYRIPGGEFHLKRCAALLNMYLTATYGEGQYVEAYHNLQIFLNHKLIEEKMLNLKEIQDKSADFLIQFSGVHEVYSANRLLLGAWTPEIHQVRNRFHRKNSGDLLIDVLPGWSLINDKGTTEKVVRRAHIPTPLIFFGNSVKPAIIETPVTIDCLAPTITHSMRIRAPNGCTATSLIDIR